MVDVSLPCTQFALATYYVVAPAEAARCGLRARHLPPAVLTALRSNLARFSGTSFGEEEDLELLDWDDLHASYARLRAQKFGCAAALRPFSLVTVAHPPTSHSAEVQRRILLGTYATSSRAIARLHGKAMAVRRRVSLDFADVFADVDVLLTPTGEHPTCAALSAA